jgi:TetR/AcrR family transcriptional regulator
LGQTESIKSKDVADKKRRPSVQNPGSRSQKSKKKRDQIVRAAIKVINAKSYSQATMSDIATSLDLRDATLYYYFPNKCALAFECLTKSLERFERILSEVETQAMSGAQKVEHLIRSMLDDGLINGPLLYLGDYSYLDTHQSAEADKSIAALTQRVEQFFKEGIEDGSVMPCETKLVVNLLLGMIIWFGKWVPTVEDITVERLMRAINVFTLHGLGGDK